MTKCDVRITCSSTLNKCSALNKVFNYLDFHLKVSRSEQDILEDLIKMLRHQRFDGNSKVGFVVEQLTLIFISPVGSKYCSR